MYLFLIKKSERVLNICCYYYFVLKDFIFDLTNSKSPNVDFEINGG